MAPEPFSVNVSPEVLQDLSARLRRTRWPDEVSGSNWRYGADLSYLRGLHDYWLTRFDWKERERLINQFPQFHAEIHGLDIHFVHSRGIGPQPFPLVLTHGWPSSFVELCEIVPRLTDPASSGGDPEDAFDVVVPSLPGFGFSERPTRPGLVQTDSIWRELMTKVLGYPRFGAQGGDIGARITSALGRLHSDVVAGIHIGSVDLDWPDPLPHPTQLSSAEQNYLSRVARWEKEEGAYADVQSTRPQTLAYGLNDSPIGLAAWIVEKFRAWSDCGGDLESRFTKDQLLTNITIYWVTQTINSSMRRYFEKRHDPNLTPLNTGNRVETPTAIAMFPGEKALVVPREWAERAYSIHQWTEMPRGGHFPAYEEPGLLVEDIRSFFRRFRTK